MPPIVIYNTYTPNGDGANDTWKITGINGYSNCEINVYNRWGQKIFSSIGYDNNQEWDGTSEGINVPTATYYYMIDLKANTDDRDAELYKGAITIIR